MQITINDTVLEITPNAAELAALGERRAAANADIAAANEKLPDDGQTAPHASDAAYLQWCVAQWAAANPGAAEADLLATAQRALASWAGAPLPDPPAPEELSPGAQVARLVAYAADARWRKEVGGVMVGGINVPTDDRAKLLLMGAAQSMPDGLSAPLIVAGVNYGTLTKAQFQDINAAVVAHVQRTFATLAAVLASINTGSITTTAAIDAAFAT